jgi:leucyl-tRNA synthetase
MKKKRAKARTAKAIAVRGMIAAPDLAKVAALVLEGLSLAEIAEQLGAQPTKLFAWLAKEPARMAQFEQARAIRADRLAHECVAIADGVQGEGNPEAVPRDTLRVKTRLQLAGKWNPTYGDKVQIAGAGGGGAVKIELELIAASKSRG